MTDNPATLTQLCELPAADLASAILCLQTDAGVRSGPTLRDTSVEQYFNRLWDGHFAGLQGKRVADDPDDIGSLYRTLHRTLLHFGIAASSWISDESALLTIVSTPPGTKIDFDEDITPAIQALNFGQHDFFKQLYALVEALRGVAKGHTPNRSEKQDLGKCNIILDAIKYNLQLHKESYQEENAEIRECGLSDYDRASMDIKAYGKMLHGEKIPDNYEEEQTNENAEHIQRVQNFINHIDKHLKPMCAALCKKLDIKIKTQERGGR